MQTVLRYLSCQDYASLRQVSQSVSQLTTQHVPYIILRLSEGSSSDQLQKWSHATRQLQHVDSVHVHVVDTVNKHVFESAVQLLSHPARNIRGLHLIGVKLADDRHLRDQADSHLFDDPPRARFPATVSDPAFIYTLLPLQQLIGRLQTLVVKGIGVEDVLGDFEQLAAAATTTGPWQLQSLTWDVAWTYSSFLFKTSAIFLSVVKHWVQAFPQLKQLSISVPPLKPPTLIGNYPDRPGMQLSMIQAVATAVVQLKGLEAVTVTGLPDIWSEAVHAEVIDPEAASEGVDVQVAAPVTTLDEYGCWLLQHHSQLRDLHICTDPTGFGMYWQKQHTPWVSSDVGGSSMASAGIDAATAPGAILASIHASVDFGYRPGASRDLDSDLETEAATNRLAQLQANYSAGSSTSSQANSNIVADHAIKQLSEYSPRSAAYIWSHISSLRLTLKERHIDCLNGLMFKLKSLKHLEVRMRHMI